MKAEDAAGVCSIEASYTVVETDSTRPTITSVYADNILYNNANLNVTASDDSAGIVKIEWFYRKVGDTNYTKVDDSYTAFTTPTTKTHPISGLEFDKQYEFYAVIYDRAGNNETTAVTPFTTLLPVASLAKFGYGTLQEAINDIEDEGVIQLHKDTTENIISIKEVTVKMNGYTLTGASSKNYALQVNGGYLQLYNGTVSNFGGRTIEINNGDTIIEDVNIINNSSYGIVVDNGDLYITGDSTVNGAYGIYMTGGGSLKISGKTQVTASSYWAIATSENASGDIKIFHSTPNDDVMVSGKSNAIISFGRNIINISAGSIISTSTTDATINMKSPDVDSRDTALNITGGTIESSSSAILTDWNYAGNISIKNTEINSSNVAIWTNNFSSQVEIGEGTVINTGNTGVKISSGGKLNMNGVTYINNGAYAIMALGSTEMTINNSTVYGIINISNYSTLNLNNTDVTASQGQAIFMVNSAANIVGGSITGTYNDAIYMDTAFEVKIDGSNINGKDNGIRIERGILNVIGKSNINANSYYGIYRAGSCTTGAYECDASISISDATIIAGTYGIMSAPNFADYGSITIQRANITGESAGIAINKPPLITEIISGNIIGNTESGIVFTNSGNNAVVYIGSDRNGNTVTDDLIISGNKRSLYYSQAVTTYWKKGTLKSRTLDASNFGTIEIGVGTGKFNIMGTPINSTSGDYKLYKLNQ